MCVLAAGCGYATRAADAGPEPDAGDAHEDAGVEEDIGPGWICPDGSAGAFDWTVEIVDRDGFQGAVIALDRFRRVHAIYDGPSGSPRYAVRARGVWTIEDVGSPVARCEDLQIAPDGSAHATCDAVPGVAYLSNATGEWVAESLTDDGSRARDLVLDAAGSPHVFVSTDAGVLHFFRDDAGWREEPLVEPATDGNTFGVSAAVDPDGLIHVATVSYDAGSKDGTVGERYELDVASGSFGGWSWTTLESGPGYTSPPEIVASAEVRVAVGFGELGAFHVYGLHADGSSELETFDGWAGFGQWAFTLADDGTIHRGYRVLSGTEVSVAYGYHQPAGWTESLVAPQEGEGFDDVQVLPADFVHLAYSEAVLVEPDVAYAMPFYARGTLRCE